MELEINKYYVYLDNSNPPSEGKRPINDENQIKGKVFDIVNVNNRLVLLTLDTRTEFNAEEDRIETVVELVLFHEDYPIETLDSTFGEELQKFISFFNIGKYIKDGKITLFDFHPKERKMYIKNPEVEHTFTVDTVNSNEIKDLMIHITCACPLKNLNIIDKTGRNFETQVGQEEEYNFLLLIGNMIAGKGSEANADPKQNMNVMNRTSFGAMFSRLKGQKYILEELKPQYGNETANITPYVGPISNFIGYFGDSKHDNDPTYRANEKENLGISKLGYSFGHDDQWPIFEFRDCGNVDINKFTTYFKGVLEKLKDRGTGKTDFSSRIILQ